MKNNFPKSPVAYFVAEYALTSLAPTYAGGLGVLAGDYLSKRRKKIFRLLWSVCVMKASTH